MESPVLPNYAHWLAEYEYWTLDVAASLLIGESPSPNTIYRSPEHQACVQWIRDSGLVEQINQPARGLITGRQHPTAVHAVEAVRVAALLAALRAQKPQVIWGRDLLKETSESEAPGILATVAVEQRTSKQHKREAAMRAFMAHYTNDPEVPWRQWKTQAQWHDGLRQWRKDLFTISGSRFRWFWKNRSQELKEAVALPDKSR
jgi:hypothetical protein